MEYIQLEKNDYKRLIENISIISNMYSSGNRRVYISRFGLLYSGNKIMLETIQKGIIYFKKLKREMIEDETNDNVECLSDIVNILKKYNK